MPRSMNEALREAFEGSQTAQPTEQVQNSEQDQDELGDEPQLDADAGQSQETEDDGVEVEYANDLGDVLGISQEDIYRLKLRLTDNEDPVALGEVKDRIQAIESERTALAQERAQFAEQQQQWQQQAMQYGQASQQVSQEMQAAWGRIKAIEESYPTLQQGWAAREKSEPGEVALERQRIGEQYSAAQQALQQAQGKAQQEQQQAYQGWLAEQHRILTEKVPEWAIPEKRKPLQDRLTKLATEHYGVHPQELQNIDARMIQVLLDAEAGIKARNGAEKAVAKVRGAPKVQPKGVRLKNAQFSKQRVQELTDRARSTRAKRDMIAATRGILEQGRK